MKILIIDRDRLSSQLMVSKLKAEGHSVVEEAVKSEAIDRIEKGEHFDVVFVDPSPMKDARAIMLNIRRMSHRYPFIVLMANQDDQTIDLTATFEAGGNTFIRKPIDNLIVADKVRQAMHMRSMIQKIGDDSEDFPSAGGVISKSAFNQLFLSCLDRGNRYGELSYTLSIGVDNYSEIETLDGKYNAEYVSSKLASHLVRLRRQSDIIGQTGINEYTLLLMRTQHPNEAKDAAARFAQNLEELTDIAPSPTIKVKIFVRLTSLPDGTTNPEYLLAK
ncbi:MAG: response regulator [Alphaproteobacteria bacterium]|nr:response regulator [Alphaproteobacteria bacterium]NCQ88599.1 response regulator [Alphaproteobacteria bacterium]NCT06142.1 response regulator [Alphaproteobacteria bacterium]